MKIIHCADVHLDSPMTSFLTPEKAKEQFGFFIEAFTYGAPPHAGLAYGLDRLIMEFYGVEDIRDVIAFPKIKNASDLMSQAPSKVDEKQLQELCLAIDLPKEEE